MINHDIFMTGYDVLVYVKVSLQRHLKQCHICIKRHTLSEKKGTKLSLFRVLPF